MYDAREKSLLPRRICTVNVASSNSGVLAIWGSFVFHYQYSLLGGCAQTEWLVLAKGGRGGILGILEIELPFYL